MTEWIACTDRQPEPYTRVVAFWVPRRPIDKDVSYANAAIVAQRVLLEGHWWTMDGGGGEWQDDYVTHWMPLPAPPVAQGAPEEARHAD